MKMLNNKKSSVLLATLMTLPVNSYGLSFTPTSDLTIDLDTSIGYTIGARVSDRDRALLLRKPNNNDGSYNFDNGDLMANRLTVLTEVDFNYKQDFGLFLRAKAFYDDIYHRRHATNHNPTQNYYSDSPNSFSTEARDQHGDDIRLLDAFVYGNFDLNGHNLSLRAGNQVVSWGESLFIPNGIASNTPVDATAAAIPGVELKEIFLPVGTLYGQIDLSDRISFEAFYQYDWDKTELNAPGSYFGDTDFVGPGASTLFTPGLGLPRVSDQKPDEDNGQWGVAVHYISDFLGETDFGFYAMEYHEQAPQIIYPGGPVYAFDYAEDTRLYGASFGTVVADANVSGEISFRDNLPVPLFSGVDRVKLWQAQTSLSYLTGPNAVADDTLILFEVGANKVVGDHAPDLMFDEFAWGYVGQVKLSYFNIAPGLDLNIPITLKHGVNGTSSALASGFREGSKAFNIGLDFRYRNNLSADFRYTNYFGEAKHDFAGDLRDRDFVTLSLKYTF